MARPMQAAGPKCRAVLGSTGRSIGVHGVSFVVCCLGDIHFDSGERDGGARKGLSSAVTPGFRFASESPAILAVVVTFQVTKAGTSIDATHSPQMLSKIGDCQRERGAVLRQE